MCKALLRIVEATCITCAKFEKVTHEYFTILGIQESIRDILINLKEIVLKSKVIIAKLKKHFYLFLDPKR